MEGFEVLVPIVFFITLFGMIVLISSMRARERRAQIDATTQLQTRMLDRFASAPEFIAFIRTEEGQRFLKQISSEPSRPVIGKILGSATTGIVLSLLGIAFVVLTAWERELIIPGLIILALGVGFLLSAWVSAKISRSWGLIGEKERQAA